MNLTMNQRAVFLIKDDVLDRFNRSVPIRTRSRIIEAFMLEHLARNQSTIEKAARLMAADPSYRDASEDADSFAVATLNRLDHHE